MTFFVTNGLKPLMISIFMALWTRNAYYIARPNRIYRTFYFPLTFDYDFLRRIDARPQRVLTTTIHGTTWRLHSPA